MHAGMGRARARQPHARDGVDNDDRDVDDAGAGSSSTTGVCPKKCERRGVYLSGAGRSALARQEGVKRQMCGRSVSGVDAVWGGGGRIVSATQRMDHSPSSVLQGARERRGWGGGGGAGTWSALVVAVGHSPPLVLPKSARAPRVRVLAGSDWGGGGSLMAVQASGGSNEEGWNNASAGGENTKGTEK